MIRGTTTTTIKGYTMRVTTQHHYSTLGHQMIVITPTGTTKKYPQNFHVAHTGYTTKQLPALLRRIADNLTQTGRP